MISLTQRCLTKVWHNKEHRDHTWEEVPFKLQKPITGIYVGYRYYRNGWVKYWHDEVPEFIFDSSVKVALIVPNERQNPIAVPFDKVEVVAEAIHI